MIKRIFIVSASSVFFVVSVFGLQIKAEMPDSGSAPAPYPRAAAFNHQYEFLGQDSHSNDGVSFRPHPSGWKQGKKVTVTWYLTTIEKKDFYPRGVHFRLFIDWNHDGDWDDAGEMVVDSYKDKVKENCVKRFTDKFTVPEYTIEGPFWARAWVSYGYPPPVFGDISTSFGEIEDYNLLSPEDTHAIGERKSEAISSSTLLLEIEKISNEF